MNELPELTKAFLEFIPTYVEPVAYKLYYDVHGNAIGMSGDNSLSGEYVVIPREVYDTIPMHRMSVAGGKLLILDAQECNMRVQLVKSAKGRRVVTNHPAILIPDTEEYADTEFYDKNHN